MTHSEQINEIAAALAKAQGAMKPAIKDATNPAYRSKYADLAAVFEAVRGPLAANGIAVVQDATLRTSESGAYGIAVTTRLLHGSGQWIEFGPLTVPCAKVDAHGVGSATSYAKRYGLSAALGIVAEDDDDGNGAVGTPQPPSKPAAVPVGFGEWWADMQSVADNGSAALQDAWKKSSPDLRRFVTEHHSAQWAALKAKAEKVGA